MDVLESRENKMRKLAYLKEESISLLEKAALAAPASTYASIAKKKIRKLEEN